MLANRRAGLGGRPSRTGESSSGRSIRKSAMSCREWTSPMLTAARSQAAAAFGEMGTGMASLKAAMYSSTGMLLQLVSSGCGV